MKCETRLPKEGEFFKCGPRLCVLLKREDAQCGSIKVIHSSNPEMYEYSSYPAFHKHFILVGGQYPCIKAG